MMRRFFRSVCFSLLAGGVLLGARPSVGEAAVRDEGRWWQDAIFYEIYPRSFQDSDGDGVGDLKGIVARLDYLQKLGVTALWITPFFLSPMVDFGYDVSDYRKVDPLFGRDEDFDVLLREAKKRGLRVVIDLVLNHTSDQHPYFLESRSSRTSPKRDWYIWKDPGPNGEPPNNWKGFEQTSWEFDPSTGQYFYHYFCKEQPDLNWRNPEVQQAMLSILSEWVARGVDGFRLDAINYLIEHPDLPDNPLASEVPPEERFIVNYDQIPRYSVNQPENFGLFELLRRHVEDSHGPDVLLLGEAWVPSLKDLLPIYGVSGQGIHLPFNFFFLQQPKLEAEGFAKVLRESDAILGTRPTTMVLSNHDMARATWRYATETNSDSVAKALGALELAAPGVPVLYYGEELGMRGREPQSLDEVRDPLGRNQWPAFKGRDLARTPVAWDEGPNGGFSTGKPWLALAPFDLRRSVAVQSADRDSVLNFYRALIALRKNEPALRQGRLEAVEAHGTVLQFRRRAGEKAILVMLNLSDRPAPAPDFSGKTLLGSHAGKWGAVLAPWEVRIGSDVVLSSSR